ncbi:MAG TPA: c-type cytochrome [Burkholderiaceae bacterium]|nr:c-type cytochrome [Burkholderiaceae bacterium]
MTTERVFSLKNRWFTLSVGGVLAVAIIAALIGFVWIPRAQTNSAIIGLWDSICTAAGVPQRYVSPQLPASPIARPSNVIVTAQMMTPADSLSIGRGATLAMQCTMCHGARGMSLAGSPNLAGQDDATIYKQLRDFKSGYRISAIMQPLVVNRDDQDMRDLAAYYHYLPRERSLASATVAQEVPLIVSNGAPMRNIGACASCHGQLSGKAAIPLLDGEPESYIRAQLQAFAAGNRHNDINEQMRNVTRHMTSEEIDAAAHYYANR